MNRAPQTARAPGHRAGMTLVEMIVALALFAVVATVVMSFLTGSRRTYGQTSDRAQYQQSLRAVFSLMTRELRSAGCDPDGPGFTGLTMADDLVIRCRMDLDADGSTLGLNPDEDVAYIYVPAAAELRRTTAAGPQTILRDVQAVQFNYFDANGDPLLATPLSADDRAAVRFVEIAIAGQAREDEPVNYTTRVSLRNN